MTREEAIDIIKCLAWHTRPNEEDIEQAIKTLEQGDILDNIAAEMEEHAYLVSHTTYTIGLPLFSILKIINKYKAESEKV